MTTNLDPAPSVRQPTSAPTHRVVSVIDHLADDVTARPTLADIIRATGMTRATAHAVLTQLCDDGWTVRDEDGRFTLASGFLTRLRDAAGARPLASTARPVLEDLRERIDMPVFLSEFDGAVVSISEIVGAIDWAGADLRVPATAPLCREYVAWASPRIQTDWLATAPSTAHDRLSDLLGTIRRRGFSVERLGPESTEVLATLHSVHRSDAVRRRLADLLMELMGTDYRPEDLDAHVPVMSIAMPLRRGGDRGTPVAVRSSIVACPGVSLSRSAIDAVVTDLRGAAAAIERAFTA